METKIKRGFEVVVAGEYVARSGVIGNERVVKNYKITCVLPRLEAALSIIKNKILGPVLKATYEDYVLFRTYHILSITPLGPREEAEMAHKDIKYMDRPSLVKFVKDHALGVPTELYPNLFDLREAVRRANEDPDGYLEHLEKVRPDLELDLEVAQLNPALQNEVSEVNAPIGSTPVPQTKSAAPKKAIKDPKKHAGQVDSRIDALAADMKKDGDLIDIQDQEQDELNEL